MTASGYISPSIVPADAETDLCAQPCTGFAARRVLFVDHTAALGGGEIALLTLVRQLDKRRYHPVVLLFEKGPLWEQLRRSNIETHVIALDSSVSQTRKDSLGHGTFLKMKMLKAALAHVMRVWQFMRRQRIDLVHTNSLKADILAGFAARLAGVPLVWHVRDRICDDYLPPAAARLFRFLARVVPDYVIANSRATLQTLNLPNHDVASVVYSGIEPRDLPLRIASKDPVVMLIGRIAPWKGQHVFLKAAARVHERLANVRFVIVGASLFSEHEYEQQVRQLPQELGLEQCVEFTGFRENVPQLLETADLLVHASVTGEPFGQVIVQAMVAGKPVVATDGGGVPEVVLNERTGLLVPMGDDRAMADAILRVLTNAGEAREFGRLGRERAVDLFSAEKSARDAEMVYRRLLGTALQKVD